jgi:hypothetical protein
LSRAASCPLHGPRHILHEPRDRLWLRHYLTVNYTHMLTTIAVILLVLWALGLVSSYTIGGFIHILLVVAIILILIRLIQGRNPIS